MHSKQDWYYIELYITILLQPRLQKNLAKGSMGGPNLNNSDKKNPAKGGIWIDLTKTIVIKKPAKGEVWVDLAKTIVIKISC